MEMTYPNKRIHFVNKRKTPKLCWFNRTCHQLTFNLSIECPHKARISTQSFLSSLVIQLVHGTSDNH